MRSLSVFIHTSIFFSCRIAAQGDLSVYGGGPTQITGLTTVPDSDSVTSTSSISSSTSAPDTDSVTSTSSISSSVASSSASAPNTGSVTSTSSISSSVASNLASAPSSIPSTDPDKFYCQNTRDGHYHCLSASDFLNSSLSELCPSGNCITDCQTDRVYQVVPSGLDISYNDYGSTINFKSEVTLFGICTQLGNLELSPFGPDGPALTSAELKVAPYFQIRNQQDQTAIAGVANNISQCLAASCQMSRDSGTCSPYCRQSDLLNSDSTTNMDTVAKCLVYLCDESCGLPYANQDVVGIGVSISYIIQAVLVIICWFSLLATSFHAYYTNEKEHAWRDLFVESTAGFLIAQCYFGIPLGIAALVADPFHIDPLNGYALLAVSISGFLPEVFTLMMLHSYNGRKWYLTLLTFTTWLLNSIVFWALHTNLMHNAAIQDSSFRSLYGGIETCGGLAATSLCLQTTNASPLSFLQDFYTNNVPGLKTVPVLWAWSTLVFCILVVDQCLNGEPSLSLGLLHKKRLRKGTILDKTQKLFITSIASVQVYLTASIIFFLAIAYQATIFTTYVTGFIDADNWAFGQVIALTLWLQPLADYFHWQFNDTLKKYRDRKRKHKSKKTTKKPNLASVDSSYSTHSTPSKPDYTYQRLPYPNSPDPTLDVGFDHQAEHEAEQEAHLISVDRNNEFEMRSRPTLRMEEGQNTQVVGPSSNAIKRKALPTAR